MRFGTVSEPDYFFFVVVAVFSGMKFALSALPEAFINMLQVRCPLHYSFFILYSHHFYSVSYPFVVLKNILTVLK